ncbi:hypothetical protein D3C81_2246660 [compost metagenome]
MEKVGQTAVVRSHRFFAGVVRESPGECCRIVGCGLGRDRCGIRRAYGRTNVGQAGKRRDFGATEEEQ